jgi:hypothetical protein
MSIEPEGGIMYQELHPGMRVRLNTPERGYRYAELIELDGLRWILQVSSGYQFSAYEDEFEVEY